MTKEHTPPGFPHPLAVAVAHDVAVRLDHCVAQWLPHSVELVRAWWRRLYGEAGLAAALLRLRSFPLLHLPFWAAGDDPSAELRRTLADVSYSSLSGYLFIRLVDDVVDGDTDTDPALLPVGALLHSEFSGAYSALFPADHHFWEVYRSGWYATADVAVADARIDDIDVPTFRAVSGRKLDAAVIPVAAVLYQTDRPEQVAPWSAAIKALGRWQQFHNDLFDGLKDRTHRNVTLITSRGERRRHVGEDFAAWFLREGFSWGVAHLAELGDEVVAATERLDSSGLSEYVRLRFEDVEERIATTSTSLGAVHRLVGALQRRE